MWLPGNNLLFIIKVGEFIKTWLNQNNIFCFLKLEFHQRTISMIYHVLLKHPKDYTVY